MIDLSRVRLHKDRVIVDEEIVRVIDAYMWDRRTKGRNGATKDSHVPCKCGRTLLALDQLSKTRGRCSQCPKAEDKAGT